MTSGRHQRNYEHLLKSLFHVFGIFETLQNSDWKFSMPEYNTTSETNTKKTASMNGRCSTMSHLVVCNGLTFIDFILYSKYKTVSCNASCVSQTSRLLHTDFWITWVSQTLLAKRVLILG